MSKKIILSFACPFIFICICSSQIDSPLWLRYSAISPDGNIIVFAYKGNLFKVSSAGGTAVPLTISNANNYMPVWSHDGKWISFASDRFGNYDIFIIPAAGGEAKRLTYHSANEYPSDFSADNKYVVFSASIMDDAANRQYPSGYMSELYKVPVIGGRTQQIITTPAINARISNDGNIIIYEDCKAQESYWRKHHVSSAARDVWMYNTSNSKHTKLTYFAGEDRNPVFTDNEKSIYYLSESSGSFNVYKKSLDNISSPVVITNFKMHPVRFLSAANDGTICFSYNGELYTKGSGDIKKVNITINSDVNDEDEKIIPVYGNASQVVVSPNGKEVAYIVRGEVFVSAVEGGITKRITNTPEQEASVSFSPDRWKVFAIFQ